MALSEPWGRQPAPSTSDRQRRRRAFQAALRHSRAVRRLRIALPMSGVLAAAALAAITHVGFPEELDLSAARMSVTPSSIIMDQPNLKGFDREERQYSISADRAIQALMNPDSVRLENIRATIGGEGDPATRITAESGDYDQAKSALKLYGTITVDSDEGFAVQMRDADIDFEAGTLLSPNPAVVTQAGMETTGNSVEVAEGGRIVVLKGGVRTIFASERAEPAVAPGGESIQQ